MVDNYPPGASRGSKIRSEEHTSELQSQSNLVCRLLLEKKKKDRQKVHGGADGRAAAICATEPDAGRTAPCSMRARAPSARAPCDTGVGLYPRCRRSTEC